MSYYASRLDNTRHLPSVTRRLLGPYTQRSWDSRAGPLALKVPTKTALARRSAMHRLAAHYNSRHREKVTYETRVYEKNEDAENSPFFSAQILQAGSLGIVSEGRTAIAKRDELARVVISEGTWTVGVLYRENQAQK